MTFVAFPTFAYSETR